jgi:hypothetical protein
MSEIKQFDFESPIQQLKIAGDMYEIDFSDDSILKKQQRFETFYQEAEKIDKEAEDYIEKTKELIKDTVDTILEKGAFDILYIKSGKSIMNILNLVEFLADIINEKSQESKKNVENKYLKFKKVK